MRKFSKFFQNFFRGKFDKSHASVGRERRSPVRSTHDVQNARDDGVFETRTQIHLRFFKGVNLVKPLPILGFLRLDDHHLCRVVRFSACGDVHA